MSWKPGARTCGVPRFMCIRSEDEPLPRIYSSFDWYTMIFGRIVNALATTCLTPVAVKLAQRGSQPPTDAADAARDAVLDAFVNATDSLPDFSTNYWMNYDDWLAVPHPGVHAAGGLFKSGGIIAAVAVGAMVSTTAAFFLLPDTWKDGKLPYVLGTVFPYLGTTIFTYDVLVSRLNIVMVFSRVVLSLGYGLQFVIKRQARRATHAPGGAAASALCAAPSSPLLAVGGLSARAHPCAPADLARQLKRAPWHAHALE